MARGTRQRIGQAFASFAIDSNVGFGRACNQGAVLATTPFLVFLNFDSEPVPGWLAALVETARRG